MDILNTCFETTKNYHSIAFYSHLVPIFISLVLIFFTLGKSKSSYITKIFSVFVGLFCLWLIGDLVLWTSQNYNLVNFSWAPLDYINVLFYLFGAYFFVIIAIKKDLNIFYKSIILILSLPAFYITASGGSVVYFDQAVCESINNDFLTKYKLFIEFLSVTTILLVGIFNFKKETKENRKKILIVGLSIILFFSVFSITEYISSVTGVYEINLYSLFILPIFLVGIIYSIINLKVFDFKVFGTQLIVYLLFILIASQFIFVRTPVNIVLTGFTLILIIFFGNILINSVKREIKQKEEMEVISKNLIEANEKLKGLDKLKTEFLSLATHQIRSPLTAIKGYTSMLLEGSFGKVVPEQQEPLERVLQTSNSLAIMVEDFLSVSKIESGGMKYIIEPFDFKEMASDTYSDLKITAEKKGLVMNFSSDTEELVMVSGDREKLRQVVINLIDNSIKYTPEGSISLGLVYENNKVIFSIKDTGVGVSPETKEKLFHKFNRGEAGKMNTTGSGLGLYLAKEIIKAHHGRVWLESEGLGKGTTFLVELPTIPKE